MRKIDKILIHTLLFLLFTACYFQPVIGQISPGELSQAHANLEGISNCKKCHDLGKKVSSVKCLDCHKEIAILQDQKKGYHASVSVTSKECFDCHNEHHGRQFKITLFDSTNFKHEETGYLLKGKHEELYCKDCHQLANMIEKNTQRKDYSKSYLGLGSTCLDCHSDYHQKTLSENCEDCHNQNAFVPAPGFDHGRTNYKLQGKHADVACKQCHPITHVRGEKFQQFQGVKYQSCLACHEDTHRGKFGNDCLECHTYTSFKRVKNLEGFNHNRTQYPLEGKHISLDCAKCHKGSYTKKLAYARCLDCHEDYHRGDFTQKGKTQDCIECHTVQGFLTSSFTIEKHNQGEFVLAGSHLATPCISCHHKTENWRFRNIGKSCFDCHENPHGSQITAKFLPENKCESCHNEVQWVLVKFDHNQTDFQLNGQHKNQTCRSCHYEQSAEYKTIQKFKDLGSDCLVCHEDQHNGQFRAELGQKCIDCHTENNWKPDLFDHAKTRFPLDGKHKNVDCKECHKTNTIDNKNYYLYKMEDISCASCHS